jgi:hypothetical protein
MHAAPEGPANTKTGTGFARASCTICFCSGLQPIPANTSTRRRRALHASPQLSPEDGECWVFAPGVRSHAYSGQVNFASFTASALAVAHAKWCQLLAQQAQGAPSFGVA